MAKKMATAQDSLAYQLGWQLRRDPSSRHAPTTDPTTSGHLLRSHLGIDATIYHGRIVDAVAFTHCYKVLVADGVPPIPCIALQPMPLLPFGARSTTTLAPGATVWLFWAPQFEYGLIIGVEPPPMTTADLCRSDQIHQASRCGLKVDGMHTYPLLTTGSGGFINVAAGRPLDSLPTAEFGAITETGLRIYLDSYMAQLGVDEATGIFAFYHDQLLRIAGVNTHQFDCGREYEGLDDQTELFNMEGWSVFPWEAVGTSEMAADAFQTRSAEQTQLIEPWYSSVEPVHDDQQAYRRLRHFRGYLGQGSKRTLSGAPPAGLFQYSNEDVLDGLWEEQVAMTGSFAMRSAKRITIAKRPCIPSPKQMRRPEDAAGDTASNYCFSGFLGASGVTHKVKDRVANSANEATALQSAAGILDVHAHLFNWEGSHPFYYHTQDWFLPEESDTFAHINESPLPIGDLANDFYMADAPHVDVPIDHRYTKSSVYLNTSYIDMNDAGGVTIGDGFGAEIRMANGHIFLSAAGDIWMQPGRNINLWGGHDVIVRAKNSIDLSATKRDIRIKAQHNLHMIGGNSGIDGDAAATGGVLIECPTPTYHDFDGKKGEDVGHGGITFKAQRGFVTTWGKNIYLRTGGGNVESGDITLDADNGYRTIYTNAQDQLQFVRNSDCTFFQTGDELASSLSHANGQFLHGQVWGKGHTTHGYHILDGYLLNRGGIGVIDGYISLDEGYYVGEYDARSHARAIDDFNAAIATQQETQDSGNSSHNDQFRDFLYASQQPGNDDVIRRTEFTHRTVSQYQSSGFWIFQTRWQAASDDLPSWIEVESHQQEMPYPGREIFESQTLWEQPSLLVDGGCSTARGDVYADPTHPAPVLHVLNDDYKVIR